ncbi:MAG: hypothetical protein AB7N80_08900 [Bdellovibrionales bacterium]
MSFKWQLIFAILGLALTQNALARADEIKLPSSATLTLGGDRQGTQNSALDLNFYLPGNWQLNVGGDSSKVPDSEEQADSTVTGGHLLIGTNPLNLFTADLEYGTWRMGDDVVAHSLNLGVIFAPADWVIRLSGGRETLKFSNLPKLIFTNGESELHDDFGSISADYMIDEVWSARIFFTAHRYDQDLGEYTEGLRVLVMPPSVLTTVTGFPATDGGIEVAASRNKMSGSIQLATSRSALDDVRTRRVQLSGSYKFHRNWRVGLMVGSSKPEKSEEDPRDNRYGSLSFTYFWR